MNDLILILLGPLLLIHLFYFVAVAKKNLSVIDTAWGLGFIVLASIGCLTSSWKDPRENVIFFMVLIWGIRLALYLHFRNHKQKEDFRYAEMRSRWGEKTNITAYFKVYLLQYALMLVVSLPILTAHSSAGKSSLNLLNYLGIFLWAIGLTWEAVADYQKSEFKKDPKNKDRVFQGGLWSLSRHPNYFGESLLWWGIAFVSYSPHHYLGFVGASFITFLLIKVSGVPLIEKRQENNPEYAAYAAKTPMFIPNLRH